jgi:hypothetical protein
MNISCKTIELPGFIDNRGSLSFIQSGILLPFSVQRVFFLYALKNGVPRGGHSHKECHQLIIGLNGVINIQTNDGSNTLEWSLSEPTKGLYVPPGIWVDIMPKTEAAALIVLASHIFDEKDYIRTRQEFEKQRMVHGNEFCGNCSAVA